MTAWLLLAAIVIGTASAATWTDYRNWEKYLIQQLTSSVSSDVPTNGRIAGETAAGWLRLAFHDAVTWDPVSGTGGAHGCLWINCNQVDACERSAPENKGFDQIIAGLETSYQGSGASKCISRADWWYLAAKVGAEWSSGGAFTIPFQWGRVDCPSTPLPRWRNRVPLGSFSFDQIGSVFLTRLGFTWDETVALMGAHSLGHAKPENSGYYGLWVPATGRFSNVFYQQMLRHRWYRVGIPPVVAGQDGKIQYKSPDVGADSMMLFTDVALGWINAQNCNITLARDNCPVQPLTSNTVQRYANDNNLWLRSFAQTFWKLSNFGYSKLNDWTGSDPGYRGPSGYAGSVLGGGNANNGYGTSGGYSSSGSSSYTAPSYPAPAAYAPPAYSAPPAYAYSSSYGQGGYGNY